MYVRDRIKELRRVPARELQPNPRNWRTHPVSQRNALRGLLAEIGYADALLARELADGTLQLVDGHLRAETTPDAVVPVLVLDVDEAEADKILLTLDPLASLAESSDDELHALLAGVQTDNGAVRALLDSLTAERDASANHFATARDRPEVDIPESYQVMVECQDEDEQRALYDRLRGEGYRCRVLTL
jgi:hypothetical protein